MRGTRRPRRERARRRAVVAGAIATLVLGAAAAPALARGDGVSRAAWQPCGDGLDCATVAVPRNYGRPMGATFEIALVRSPAAVRSQRLGSVFVNPGGPGGSGVALVRGLAENQGFEDGPFAELNRRLDVVGFDPRGVGASRPSIQCLTDQEAAAQFSLRLPTPETVDVPALASWAHQWIFKCLARNASVLPYVSTGNAARDLDVLRAAVGDDALTYLGYSYGTLLGATYASLFPRRTRALVLDGAIDASTWIRRPLEATREEAAAFERALNRYFACAGAGRVDCAFSDEDPEVAFDDLVDRLNRRPIAGAPGDLRPVSGDTVLLAAEVALYDRSWWALLTVALELADAGIGGPVQRLADLHWGIGTDGSYDHQLDRFLAISGLDQRHPSDLRSYLTASEDNYAMFPHFWWGSGYLDLPWGLLPTGHNGAFAGPFELRPSAPTALVVGTTFDPATPYIWARRLTAELGNARLLTMVGDGHTAFGGNSPCIDDAVVAYVENLTLPAAGTRCRQRTGFTGVPAAALGVRIGDRLIERGG